MVDKIGYTRPPVAAKSVRKSGSVGASGFSDALLNAQSAYETGEAAPTQAAAPTGAVGSLIGFQEVESEEFERRKAFKKGRLTLEALSQLRDALLFGELPISTIKRLENLVNAERGLTNDPALNAILDEIELRAAVEVAKLEVALGGRLPD